MNDQAPVGGIQRELGWLGMGFVLPCASLTFYRQAVRRKLTSAVLFFLVFSLALSCVSALSLAGAWPRRGRILRLNGGSGSSSEQRDRSTAQPLVYSTKALAVDTTGNYRQLDPRDTAERS